jgi:hypothetical protein
MVQIKMNYLLPVRPYHILVCIIPVQNLIRKTKYVYKKRTELKIFFVSLFVSFFAVVGKD